MALDTKQSEAVPARSSRGRSTVYGSLNPLTSRQQVGDPWNHVVVAVGWTTCDAQLRDAEEITRLHRRAAQTGFAHIFPPEAPPPPFQDDLALWRCALGPDAEQGRKAHTVRLDGRIIGVALAGPDPEDLSVGHLSRVYVDPTTWGAGVGTALHHAATADLAGRGFAAATLWVLEDNVRARRWYERLGWTQTRGRKATLAPADIFDAQYVYDLRATR